MTASKVWDTLAIAEYLDETQARGRAAAGRPRRRARIAARSAGEMHSGFSNLRSALPMNLKAHHPGFKVWAGAQADIERITAIWRECLRDLRRPVPVRRAVTMADAMYAPVCTRFLTYDVKLDRACAAYRDAIMDWPAMQEWIAAARAEPDELEELDVEF